MIVALYHVHQAILAILGELLEKVCINHRNLDHFGKAADFYGNFNNSNGHEDKLKVFYCFY